MRPGHTRVCASFHSIIEPNTFSLPHPSMRLRRKDLSPLVSPPLRIRIRVCIFPRRTPPSLSMLLIRPARSCLTGLHPPDPHRTQPELLIPYSRTTTAYDEENFRKRDRSAISQERIYNQMLIGVPGLTRDQSQDHPVQVIEERYQVESELDEAFLLVTRERTEDLGRVVHVVLGQDSAFAGSS